MANYSYISPPPPPTPYPSYSPPPPSPPMCNNHSTVPPPPTPACNMSLSPPPPPTRPPPPPPPPPNCTCVCPAPPPLVPNIAPQPQPPPPGNPGNTTYVVVFVSLGGVFFLAFLAVGLLCLARRKRRPDCPVEVETCVEEHQHIEETITTGPCGEQTVTVSIDDDKQIHKIAEACVIEPGGAGPSSHAHASNPHNL